MRVICIAQHNQSHIDELIIGKHYDLEYNIAIDKYYIKGVFNKTCGDRANVPAKSLGKFFIQHNDFRFGK